MRCSARAGASPPPFRAPHRPPRATLSHRRCCRRFPQDALADFKRRASPPSARNGFPVSRSSIRVQSILVDLVEPSLEASPRHGAAIVLCGGQIVQLAMMPPASLNMVHVPSASRMPFAKSAAPASPLRLAVEFPNDILHLRICHPAEKIAVMLAREPRGARQRRTVARWVSLPPPCRSNRSRRLGQRHTSAYCFAVVRHLGDVPGWRFSPASRT